MPLDNPPAYTWPEAHTDPQLTGVSQDPTISASNASQLGVHWMANLTAQALSSPVVGYNSQLGRTLVYAGSEGGWFSAFDAETGQTVWSVNLGSAVRVTPVIDGDYIWVVDTYSPELFKLDASTGATQCETPIYAVAEASPIVVTPPGGSPTVFMGSNDLGESGPLYSIDEATCAVNWAFTGYAQTSGLWDFISYGIDATGEPLVLFGTADPDAGIYALDANTGAEVWRFQTYNPDNGPADVGAGVTVALPGSEAGGADGMAFVASKDGNMYGLDLTTGAQDWVYAYDGGVYPPVGNGSRATAALDGTNLVFGTSTGTFDVNAQTGALIWHYVLPNGDENLGAPAIAGPAGDEVVFTTNVYGQFQVLSLATGALLYSYQTSNYLASSPAVVDGNVLITAADGFLYDFALGGGNGTTPTTSITSPAANESVANPSPNDLVITGTASDPGGVQSVAVDVQSGSATGQWWDGNNQTWDGGAVTNQATLSSPGATSTTWSLAVPVPAAGTSLTVWASAANTAGISDTSCDSSQQTGARIAFSVQPSIGASVIQLSQTRVPPGGQVTVTGSGFQAGEQVALTLPTSVPTTLATAMTDGTGAFSTAATIPVGLPFGPMTLTATGVTSGDISTALLVIANNWDEFGNSMVKHNFEVNDKALNNSVAAGGRFYLNQAYNFPVGSAIRTSVAIDNGYAYFGDDSGNMYSVEVSSGNLAWESSNSPSGIDSSPAVDSGLVIVGTEAATVVALDQATGNQVWSTTVGGSVESSPTVVNGVVYVGADDSCLYALDEQSGSILWKRQLFGAVQSSPAYNSLYKTVVVGDDGGHVTSVRTVAVRKLLPGSIVWTVVTGGPVVAAPTVYTNNVFVGSEDGNEYALVGKTGAPLWTFPTGGPVTANNVTFGTNIGVGSQGGTIYYLSAKYGTITNSLPGTVPIVGLAGAVNFAVATLANGSAFATRVTGIDETWKLNTDGYGIDSAPVINDGNVYITGLDENLRVFSIPGRPVY